MGLTTAGTATTATALICCLRGSGTWKGKCGNEVFLETGFDRGLDLGHVLDNTFNFYALCVA